ncbi:hypothetical protein ODD08_004647 [Salmonella enterica]|nr:hypothetical protein [Salmonella enterica]
MKKFTMRNADRWPMHGNVSFETLNKKAFWGRELKWGEIPEHQKDKIDFIEFIPTDMEHDDFPDVVRTLKNLKRIAIPTWFVPTLKNSAIPSGVETIIVGLLNESRKKVNWIKDEVFYNISELQGVGGGVGFFSDNFPNLTNLHINISKGEVEFDELISLSKLQSLIIEKPLTLASVNKLSVTDIRYLMLLSGKFSSLSGMSDIISLSKLEIRHCELSDLNGIQKLTNVNDIDIFGCKKITDIKPIADLPLVNKVHIIGCGSKWNDPSLPDYFRVKGFTQIIYEPDRVNSLFEAIRL